MIKRILVALDPDQDTKVATRYASELAERFDAFVLGLAIVHTQRIAAEVGPGGAIGAQYYAEKVRASLTNETRRAASTPLDSFDEDLTAAHVEHSTQLREGVPYRRIVEERKYHDLFVIGRSPDKWPTRT